MTYAYTRVSTDLQTTENQIFEIEAFCTKKGFSVDKRIDETASSTIAIDNRALGKVLSKFQRGDTLIITELSRLGRSLYDVMEKLNLLMKRGVALYSIKENFELADNIQSKVVAFAFSLSAEIERQLISQRTKALAAKRQKE